MLMVLTIGVKQLFFCFVVFLNKNCLLDVHYENQAVLIRNMAQSVKTNNTKKEKTILAPLLQITLQCWLQPKKRKKKSREGKHYWNKAIY